MKTIINAISTFFEVWANACYASHLARTRNWAGAKSVMTRD